jgi:hypothetical protein
MATATGTICERNNARCAGLVDSYGRNGKTDQEWILCQAHADGCVGRMDTMRVLKATQENAEDLAKELARELVALRISRRICCDPYDCMCHESCAMEENAMCGICWTMKLLTAELYGVCYLNELNGPEWFCNAAEQKVAADRHDFYLRALEEGDENAEFWTDQE